eukprot:scaffold5190_cov16-Tisochrysis_lutea.AAC.1
MKGREKAGKRKDTDGANAQADGISSLCLFHKQCWEGGLGRCVQRFKKTRTLIPDVFCQAAFPWRLQIFW